MKVVATVNIKSRRKKLRLVRFTRPRFKEAVVLTEGRWYQSPSRLIVIKDDKSDKTENYKFTYYQK